MNGVAWRRWSSPGAVASCGLYGDSGKRGRETGAARVFAGGLRNPVGLAWEPGTETLWTVVNERDMLGSALVPDYLTAVELGDHFGWPYQYTGGFVQPARAW